MYIREKVCWYVKTVIIVVRFNLSLLVSMTVVINLLKGKNGWERYKTSQINSKVNIVHTHKSFIDKIKYRHAVLNSCSFLNRQLLEIYRPISILQIILYLTVPPGGLWSHSQADACRIYLQQLTLSQSTHFP